MSLGEPTKLTPSGTATRPQAKCQIRVQGGSRGGARTLACLEVLTFRHRALLRQDVLAVVRLRAPLPYARVAFLAVTDVVYAALGAGSTATLSAVAVGRRFVALKQHAGRAAHEISRRFAAPVDLRHEVHAVLCEARGAEARRTTPAAWPELVHVHTRQSCSRSSVRTAQVWLPAHHMHGAVVVLSSPVRPICPAQESQAR
jgi:hypothetical protein